MMSAANPRGPPMPVTAKLSKLFYERLGEQIANELVDWFNQVDATYRSDLRELNELNFARFDAKLEQRIAELRAEMRAGFAGADAKLEQRLAETESRLTRRMFGFWIGQVGATAGPTQPPRLMDEQGAMQAGGRNGAVGSATLRPIAPRAT
jgi:hypothetical protein